MMNNKQNNRKRSAFTLVEVMLALVVLSLVIASSATMITKKHKVKPKKAVHGQYGCFRDNNNVLHEYLKVGQSLLYHHDNTTAGFTECSLDVPKNATYLYIQLVGGGGAGGNSNYDENIPNYIETQKYINLVTNEFSSGSSKPFKELTGKSKGNLAKDKANNVNGGSIPGGIDKAYVNSKFESSEYFSWDMLKHIVNNTLGIRMFAYDYGGDGGTGFGAQLTALQGNSSKLKFQCGDFVGDEFGSDACFKNLVNNGLLTNNKKCVFGAIVPEGIFKACPEYYEKRVMMHDPTVRTCFGQEGGKGSIITSDPIKFDEYTFPILGRRSNSDNSIKDYNDTNICDFTVHGNANSNFAKIREYQNYSIDYICKIANSAAVGGNIQWNNKFSARPNTTEYSAYPYNFVTESGIVKQFDSVCPTYLVGGRCKNTSIAGVNWGSGSASGKAPRYNSFLTTSPSGVLESGAISNFSFDEIYHAGDADYLRNMQPGGLPFFTAEKPGTSQSGNVGVMLHSGSNCSNSGGCVPKANKYYSHNAWGNAGRRISLIEIQNMMNPNKTFRACPNISPASPSTGKNTLDPTWHYSLAGFLGFKYNNEKVKDIINAEDRPAPIEKGKYEISTSITENQFALNIKQYYASRHLTYGLPGYAGVHKEVFTRTISDAKIYFSPGQGGTPLNISAGNSETSDAQVATKQGRPSVLYHSCSAGSNSANRASTCSAISALGGLGGKAFLPDIESNNHKYKNVEVYNFINNTTSATVKNRIFKCSKNSPSGSADAKFSACSGDDSYVGKKSEFQISSTLIDMPDLGIRNPDGSAFVMEDFGKGGDAGYMAHTCWITPQYYTLNNLYMLNGAGSSINLPAGSGSFTIKSGDIIGNSTAVSGATYAGYLTFMQSKVSATCDANNSRKYIKSGNTYVQNSSGKYYAEQQATKGHPGAIVVTW